MIHYSLTFKEWSKVKSDTTKRFLKVDCTLQTSKTNNKQHRGNFMPTCHSLTLKKWPTVKSDSTKRLAAYGFLEGDCTLQTSRSNNKLVIGTFILTRPRSVKSDTTKRFAAYGLLHLVAQVFGSDFWVKKR